MSVCLYIPKAIEVIAEAWVSLKRMEEFLTLPDSKNKESIEIVEEEILEEGKVSFHNGYDNNIRASLVTYFKADDDMEKGTVDVQGAHATASNIEVLRNISFHVRSGELLAVAGPVGCGKTSILMLLLKELPLKRGMLKVKGSVAYASQQSWIMSGSVRDNILMGKPYQQGKYLEAITACALTADLESFQDGDHTVVGEQGSALSGGQRARISLARAVYSNADIVLLDDPLSAVDASVAKQLFDNCIKGVLANKTVILVSHQVQFLQSATKILHLQGGETYFYGTYDEMIDKGIDIDLQEEEKSPLPESPQTSELSEPLSMTDRRWTLARPSRLSPFDSKVSQADMFNTDTDNFIMSMARVSKTFANDERDDALSPYDEALKNDDRESRVMHNRNIGWRVYAKYFSSGGSWIGLFMLILFQLSYQVLYITSDYWLSFWTSINAKNGTDTNESEIETGSPQVFLNGSTNSPPVEKVPWFESHCRVGNLSFGCLETYLILILSIFVLGLGRAFYTFIICIKGSNNLHNKMFHSVMKAPMSFFDNNPIGKILSRFSQDIDWMDILIPYTSFSTCRILVLIFGSVLVTIIINPWLILGLFPLCLGFIFLRKFYLNLSRNIKRLEGITRSPMSSHVNCTMSGIHTIRSLKAESFFFNTYCQHQDLHTTSWFLFQATARWFALRMELICSIFTAFVAFFAILGSDSVGLNAGLVGFSLTYALSLTGWFQWGVRQSADLENQMVSVERVVQYTMLPEEPDLLTPDGKIAKVPPSVWPEDGGIVTRNINFRYAPDLPAILKNVSIDIKPREKVGIVGRTGAGKSSFLQMLFRMGVVEGHLYIDGIDANSIQLSHLRSNIAIIPQEPVILKTTVRKNLDPLEENEDADIWNALADVQLKEMVKNMPLRLETEISPSSFSVGQSQIFCLARAILRNNKIVVVDEATANLDNTTDELVQKTIREKFAHCTVLTIAHRLQTIIDSDRVLVMDAGKVAEFDSPHLLLQNSDSQFSALAQKTGKEACDKLKKMAEVAYVAQKIKSNVFVQQGIEQGDAPP